MILPLLPEQAGWVQFAPVGREWSRPPSEEAEAALAGITASERLEALSERLLDVESWEELLAG